MSGQRKMKPGTINNRKTRYQGKSREEIELQKLETDHNLHLVGSNFYELRKNELRGVIKKAVKK
jgi:hypothetical protein